MGNTLLPLGEGVTPGKEGSVMERMQLRLAGEAMAEPCRGSAFSDDLNLCGQMREVVPGTMRVLAQL